MKRFKTMLTVDVRRLFLSRFFWILEGICLAMPILILVMTTMMDGSVSVNPQTGVETVIEGFDYVWQIIGTVNGTGETGGAEGALSAGAVGTTAGIGMEMTDMCNINLLYMMIAVLVCIFVAGEFRSGFAKNLFAVRAPKVHYVISKIIVSSLGAVAMFLAFYVGTVVGGAISGLPFAMEGINASNLWFCFLSKLLLILFFTGMDVFWSLMAKDKSWLSILLSLMSGMLIFLMIPMLTPLNAGRGDVFTCLIVGLVAAVGFGAGSVLLLKRKDLLAN